MFVLSALLFSQAFAIPPPKPIEGSASIVSKSFSTSAGDFSFDFNFPSGWGMGEMHASAEGWGSFHLFPVNGGIGCSIEITKFDNANLAKNALQDFRKTFKSTSKLQDGFEVELPKAFYACRAKGDHLIQIWYSMSKKKKEHAKNWESLKNCVSVSLLSKAPLHDKEQEFLPVVESPIYGWICNHPNNQLRVIFDSHPFYTCIANVDNSAAYLLQIKHRKCHGFFYVKWDQTGLDKSEPYHEHLQEMLQDVLKIEPDQQFSQAPEFNLKDGYAILYGNPYGLVTLSGDGFLFGFAVKAQEPHSSYDINDLIKRIKWQKYN